jgi:hypothetical protein
MPAFFFGAEGRVFPPEPPVAITIQPERRAAVKGARVFGAAKRTLDGEYRSVIHHSLDVATHEVIEGERERVVAAFADYESLEDSCRDHAWLTTHGATFRAAWQAYQANRDLRAMIAAVAGTYATDPSYRNLITAIAGQANVAQAIIAARQETTANA